MHIENYIDLSGELGFSGLFFAAGSFGTVDGNVSYSRFDTENKTVFEYTDGAICLQAEFVEEQNGIVIRRDKFQNLSNKELEINSLLSRFILKGNAYEVYTQYNGWQHESQGEWQKLVTQINAASEGMRTCDGATPMMGFHDLYTGKNTVFHLLPNAQWQMTAKKFPCGDCEITVMEAGFHNSGLCLRVAPSETIELPTIVFFSAESKTDLDAYKLHEWYNKCCPRRNLPILYNSWLYCFDKLNIEDLLRQVDCAAEMGFEAFMIDAGWFGTGEDWFSSTGDWEENMTGGPCGRLNEISERVRQKGMIFGLWFEPERAAPTSMAVAEHPDYYINQKFLDFANPDALDYILDVISKQIDKYNIGWLKLDFNSTIPQDPAGNGFYRYIKGHKEFILRLRERYPDIYITNCASGGYRMELAQGMLCDSFWFSDNQGPYEGIRIVKDTLKRLPTALIERWNVQKYCEGFPAYPAKKVGRMIHCNNGTWDFLIGIDDSFSEEFVKGGPLGFSCDIDAFPTEYKKRWSDVIAHCKKDREFYKTAAARILVDFDSVTVIQYSDTELKRCIIQIFIKSTHARELLIYPVVDEAREYVCLNTKYKGTEIHNNGLLINNFKINSCQTIELLSV